MQIIKQKFGKRRTQRERVSFLLFGSFQFLVCRAFSLERTITFEESDLLTSSLACSPSILPQQIVVILQNIESLPVLNFGYLPQMYLKFTRILNL